MPGDARRLGVVSSAGIVLLSAIYAGVTIIGLSSLKSADDPIGDPWFSMMEALILAIAPLLLCLMAALHAVAEQRVRRFAFAALASMAIAVAITFSLHLAILISGHDPFAPGTPPFRWPSLSYTLDIAAWDGFFAAAVLLAIPMFGSGGLAGAIRALLATSGILALAGLLGPISGAMQFRAIGIAGYAIVFPLAAGLIGLWFARR